jgi:acyl carrier protein
MTDRIQDIFLQELGVGADIFCDDLAYNSIPEWTSSSHMVIIIALEEAYGIELGPDDIVEATTVGKIRQILGKLGIAA